MRCVGAGVRDDTGALVAGLSISSPAEHEAGLVGDGEGHGREDLARHRLSRAGRLGLARQPAAPARWPTWNVPRPLRRRAHPARVGAHCDRPDGARVRDREIRALSAPHRRAEPSPRSELFALLTGVAMVLVGVVTCVISASQFKRILAGSARARSARLPHRHRDRGGVRPRRARGNGGDLPDGVLGSGSGPAAAGNHDTLLG